MTNTDEFGLAMIRAHSNKSILENKDDVKDQHWQNRLLLEEQGVHELLQWDED